MSAIVAVARAGLDEADRAWLRRAVAISRRAGPDGSGDRAGDRCGLGHALLRTSPRDAAQPATLGDDLRLAGDVRLDDRDELARSLAVDPACDDAELVLHAYRRWGEGCLDRLAGDFAFACWDGRRRRLLCARDQLGVAPLHYAFAGDRLLVASLLDALLAHPEVGDDLDERWIAAFLTTGSPPDRASTACAGIRQLPPAHVLTWEEGTVRLRRYWRLPEWEPLVRFPHANDYGDRFRELLDRAVADRVTAERAVVLLSGGMDSTSVAASAREVRRARRAPGGSLRALTIGLGAATGDPEPELATLVAQRLGMEADLVEESSAAPTDPFGPPVVRTAEPVDYPATGAKHVPAIVSARHAPVALTGHGGDPLLRPEAWYWLEWPLRGRFLRTARCLAEPVRVLHARPQPGLRLLRGYGREASVPRFLDRGFVHRNGIDLRPRAAPPFDRMAGARGMAAHAGWPELFKLGDPAFHGIPVKMRHPLTDLRLIAFVRSLPPDPWLLGKRVMRDAARGRLPDVVLRRPKTLLVSSPRPAVPAAVVPAAARLVEESPHTGRFFAADALVAALREQANGGPPAELTHVARALGFLYWAQHRQNRPLP